MSIFESFYGVNVEQSRRSAMPDLPMKTPKEVKPKPLRKKRKAKPEPGFFSKLGKVVTGKAKIKKRVRSGPDGLVKRKRRKRA